MNTLIAQCTRRRFLVAAGIILAVTGIAKLVTVTGDTTLLRVADPLFGIEFRYLMLGVGLVEVFIAAFCLFSLKEELSLVMVAGISAGFVVYRVGIRMFDWERPCGCLGQITDVLAISPGTAEGISIGFLSFLLIGSYSLLFSGLIRTKN